MGDRSSVVSLAESWVGKNMLDHIISVYNSRYELSKRKIKMQKGWPWCAATWSAAAIEAGVTDTNPIEISCGQLIEMAKEKGIWVENDGYVPKPGDGVLYDWDDCGSGDNTGWPDHIGRVVYSNAVSGYFVVVEGNYNNAVKKRTVSVNGKYIRGFIVPKFEENDAPADKNDKPIIEPKSVTEIAREVITGQWGSGQDRKKRLESNSYNYDQVQAEVNRILNGSAVTTPTVPDQNQPVARKVTATCSARIFNQQTGGTYEVTASPHLYCRNDAGTNKKALCKIPKGTKVKNYGYYTVFNGVRWLYIQFVMDGVQYTGFSSSDYLKKIS